MLIALQLVGTPQGPVDDEPVRSFEEDQIVIGRAPNCHVVLPDGLRIISRQHVRLTTQRGDVMLTCLSASAPVRVNAVSVPHGGVLALRSGDVIHIGGFDLRVSLPGATGATGKARAISLSPPVAAPAPVVIDLPISVPAAALVSLPAAVPEAAAPIAAAALPLEPAPLRRGRARLDEWFDLEPAQVPQDDPTPVATPAAPATSAVAATGLALDLDLRSGAYPPVQPKGPQSRVFESLQQVLSPQVEAPSPSAVPLAPAVQLPLVPPSRDPAPATSLDADADPDPDPDLVLLDVSSPAVVADEPPAPDDPAGDELMQAFLEGAGLAPRMGTTNTQMLAPMALTPAWMRHIGQLLRASVEGSLALLHSRSTVKREMRAEVTVIARRQNNPLKFAPDALAALAHLVAAKRTPGFLEPVAALKDAHEDLLLHHLAVVAGMRAAMFELIASLGPDEVVRKEGPPKGLAMSLPTLQEAALWRRYRQRHAEMTARLDDDFEAVFGREFTKAYEAQARRVREQAPPEDTSS